MNRRRFVLVAGTAGMVGVAGCLGFGDDDENGDGDDEDEETGTPAESVSAALDWTPAEPEAGIEITFDASESEGNIEEFRWTIGEAEQTTDGATTAEHFGTPGEQTVEVEVVGEDGATDTMEDTVTVVELDEFATATDALTEAADRLASLSNLDTFRSMQDVEEVEEVLDGAEGALESVETVADGDLDGRVPAAESVLAFQRGLIETHINDVDLFGHISLAERFGAVDAEIATAESPDDVDPSVPDAEADGLDISNQVETQLALYDDLEDEYGDLDATRLDEPSLNYDGSLEQHVRHRADDYQTLEELVSVYRAYIRGIHHVFEGWNHFGAKQWEQAADSFSLAEEQFQTAIDTTDGLDTRAFDRVSTDIPGNIGEIEMIAEFMQGFVTEASAFHEAATTAADGNIDDATEQFDELVSEYGFGQDSEA